MAAEEKKSFAHNFLHFYRRVLMYFVVGLLLLGMFIFYFEKSFVEKAQDEYNSLCNAARTECVTADANAEMNQLMQTLAANGAWVRFRMESLEYGDSRFTEETLAEFAQSFSSDITFYFVSDQAVFSSPKGRSCLLTEEQLNLLLQKGTLLDGESRYFGVKMRNGALVMQAEAESQLTIPKLAAFYSCNRFAYRTDTGEIVDVYDDGELAAVLQGKNINDVALYPQVGEKIDLEEDCELLIFTPRKGILPNLSQMILAVRSNNNVSDGLQTVFYVSICAVASNALRMISVPMLMMLLFAVISIQSSVYFRRRWKEARIEGKKIRLGKKLLCESAMAKNTLFVEGCFFALVLVIGLFIQCLADFADLYGDAQTHLDGLTTTLEQNQGILDYVQDRFEYSLELNTDSVVNYLSWETEPENIESNLNQMKTLLDAEEISVYDENGVIQYSTESYEGYQISKMEQDSEYRLWELINGEHDSLIYETDSENGVYCCAQRRKDAIGIVAVTKTDYKIRNLKSQVNADNMALNTDFATSDKLFVNSENPTVLYRIPSGANAAQTLSNRLPVLENLQELTAVKVIEKNLYFVCGLGFSGVTVYNADPVQPILSNTLDMGVGMLLVCAAISFFVLLGTCVYTEDTVQWFRENVHMTKKEIQHAQRGSLYCGWIASASLAGLFLLLDCVLSKTSILSFLFFGNWVKEWNIFACAMAILALVTAILLNRLLRAFFRMLCKNLSSYSVTICEMLNSVLTLLIYLWMLIYVLVQFGVDAKTILAGIGISGLAISFAAKGTIEDLLSGIFLIVDGRVRVGDYIQVDDFEGEITHIGIRTTKIQRWNNEISINNSDMRNIVNCSRGEFYTSVHFVVPYGTDLRKLQQILEKNADRFMERGNGLLLEAPYLSGASGFRFNGIRVSVLVQTQPDRESSAKKLIYTQLLEILKENGISVRG